MSDKSVLIRADGSAIIGMGHIRRCLAFAQAFKVRGYRVFFACHHAGSVVKQSIEAAGLQLLEIDVMTDDPKCAALHLARMATLHRARWIVIDHPEITIEHERLVLTHCSSRLAIIDGQFRYHDCNLLINPNAFATADKCRHTVPTGCKILAGYRYFLLDDLFLNRRPSSKVADGSDHIKRILVTLGAADPENLTLQICSQFAETNFGNHRVQIDVVLGPTNSNRQAILQFFASQNNKRFVLHDAPDNLVELLGNCSLCVSAAGITLGEAAFFATPIIGIAILENQHSIIESLAKLGMLKIATPATVAIQCVNLLNNPQVRTQVAKNARALVDGLGKERIVDIMCEHSQH